MANVHQHLTPSKLNQLNLTKESAPTTAIDIWLREERKQGHWTPEGGPSDKLAFSDGRASLRLSGQVIEQARIRGQKASHM